MSPRLPVNGRGDHVEAFGDVLGVGDLVGVGADELCEAPARALDQLEELRLVGRAVQHAIVEMRVERRAHFAREHARAPETSM